MSLLNINDSGDTKGQTQLPNYFTNYVKRDNIPIISAQDKAEVFTPGKSSKANLMSSQCKRHLVFLKTDTYLYSQEKQSTLLSKELTYIW